MAWNWHFYEISPIDFGWEHTESLSEAVEKIVKNYDPEYAQKAQRQAEVGLLLDDFSAAVEAFHLHKEGKRQFYWEGDFCKSRGPRVFWMPNELGMAYGFVWKQGNNGTTYVASPFALPWLDGIRV